MAHTGSGKVGELHATTRAIATVLAMVGLLCVTGCAKVNDVGLGLVSTSADGYLLVPGQLLKGEVVLIPDRTGRVTFAGSGGLTCAGGMRYTATRGITVDLRCSDGAEVGMQVSMLSETKGYGYGLLSGEPVSLAFGLSASDARAYLRVPQGKTLALKGEGGELELK